MNDSIAFKSVPVSEMEYFAIQGFRINADIPCADGLNVSRSFSRSSGPNPKAAVVIEGLMKYRVSEVLLADFDLSLGFPASESSITNNF